ncbi:hypothetical protein [Paenibacillus sp. 481]|uniref:hypothetical protein n=1 Tax=Paenibacillus sp. 481 TaxID=2835869 RepID=UPI001E4F9444|nr:hypothetical protein [Paenibacillus sp. 481]
MDARIVSCNSIGVYQQALTRGKVYVVVDENKDMYRIVGDHGKRVWIHKENFLSDGSKIVVMKDWRFDDNTETERFVEVTITFNDGSKRWCILTTPTKLMEYFNNESMDPPGMNIKYLIIMKTMEKEDVEKMFIHLDNQGELQESTLPLNKS